MCGAFQIRAERRSTIVFALFLILAGFSSSAHAADYFAATDGRPNYDGSFQRPYDLVTALSVSSPARAGDTIWIRGGTYSGYFRSDLFGSPSNPIVVRPYNNERVIIDGIGIVGRYVQTNILDIRGADVQFWNLEVRDSLAQRSYPNTSSPPRPIGISVYGQRIKVINPIVHDAGRVGIGLWNSGDSEVHGALVFNNGYMDPNPSGHGFYIQNDGRGTTTRVTNSVSFNNFQMGLHAYGEGGTVDGLTLDQYVGFNNGSPSLSATRRDANLFVGPRSNPATRILITQSHSYHPNFTDGIGVRLGYTASNRDVVARGNYFMSGSRPVNFTTWDSVTFEGNTVYAAKRPAGATFYERAIVAQNLNRAGPYTWRSNVYYDQTTPEGGTTYHPFEVIPNPTAFIGTFPQWQAYMGDWTSTYQIARPPDRVFVQANRYERGRAFVVVYNWSGQSSASIDLSQTGLTPGQAYELWDVQNMSGTPLATGSYSGGSITVPLNLTRVLQPTNWSQTIAHTSSEFTVFLVRPVVASGGSGGPTPLAAVSLTSPAQGFQTPAPGDLTLTATASVLNDQVREVSFYNGGTLISTDQSSPYSATWSGVPAGIYTLQAKVTGMSGASAMSNTATVTVAAGPTGPPSNGTAAFIKTDSQTQGQWKGVYGSQGYAIVGDTTSLGAGAKVTPSGHSTWTWAAGSTDPRALQRSSSGALASAWYATAFTTDVSFSDGQSHQVALYVLDWDQGGRTQQIDVVDAGSGALLDRRSVSNFSNGQYLVWRVSGAVKIQVTRQAGYNAVISGVFVDSDQSTNVTQATFVKSDTATKGQWKNVYGAQGSAIANNAAQYPSYAKVTHGGSSTWTWAQNTTDVRALQTSTGRIASTWYGQRFTIEVQLTDGRPHNITLHAIDWDLGARAQTIEVSDAVTGTVFDRRSQANFGNGEYLTWQVTGKVRFTVTRQSGYNAVVGGIFVD